MQKMRCFGLVCFLTGFAFTAISQEQNNRRNPMDSLCQGGHQAFISENHNQVVYPKEVKEEGIFGTVYYQFEIDTNGTLVDFKILRSPHPKLSEAAREAFSKTGGKWVLPTDSNEHKVPIRLTYSIYFELR